MTTMELRHYWQIIWRRWWLIAILVAAVLIISLATYRPPAPVYQATLRFAIGIEGDGPVNATSGEGRSDAWLASEYLADDLSQVLRGGDFAARVSERTGLAVPAGVIFASREHRIMTVNITWPDRDQVQKIAEVVGAIVQDGGADYFPQLAGVEARAILIDGPGIGEVGRSLKDKLDLPIRLFVALLAGVALAFLLDYLDDSVRSRAELESLDLRVVGEIPRAPLLRRRRKTG
jgi:capsular polysaccharide biosynthesis protein